MKKGKNYVDYGRIALLLVAVMASTVACGFYVGHREYVRNSRPEFIQRSTDSRLLERVEKPTTNKGVKMKDNNPIMTQVAILQGFKLKDDPHLSFGSGIGGSVTIRFEADSVDGAAVYYSALKDILVKDKKLKK